MYGHLADYGVLPKHVGVDKKLYCFVCDMYLFWFLYVNRLNVVLTAVIMG